MTSPLGHLSLLGQLWSCASPCLVNTTAVPEVCREHWAFVGTRVWSKELGVPILKNLALAPWSPTFLAPWTARRSNQSILKEISPGISLEGMMLKLKLQY